MVGSFDQLVVDEEGAGADESDEVGWVHAAPAGLGRFDQISARARFAAGVRPSRHQAEASTGSDHCSGPPSIISHTKYAFAVTTASPTSAESGS